MMTQRKEQDNRKYFAHEPVLPRSRAWQWRMPTDWTPLSCKLAPKRLSFTPLSIYNQLPAKFASTAENKELSAIYSPENIHSLGVEVFYIWPPKSVSGRPLLLVPSGRFLALFEDICTHLGEPDIQLPPAPDTIGLINNFEYHPHLYPRYLGYIRSQESYREIIARDKHDAIPSRGLLPRGEERSKHPPGPESLEKYARTYGRIKRLVDSGEASLKSMEQPANEKDAERVVRIRSPTASQKTIERALGLRPAKVNIDVSKGETWTELEAAERARIAAVKQINELGPADVDLPPQYQKEVDPIIIAFDIECYERDQRKVTEIGIATVDTAELHDSPGEFGKNWYEKIRSRHFRIKEHLHLVNKDFVQGCPDRFDHGFSEFIGLEEAPHVIASCFSHPYSPNPHLDTSSPQGSAAQESANLSERKVIVVGHDPSGDIRWLSMLGINLHEIPRVERTVIDTKYLYRDMTQEKDFRSLAHILSKFNISAWNLHNAGNDATLTMQALMAIVVTSAAERGTSAQLARIQESVSEQEEKAAVAAKKAAKAKAHQVSRNLGALEGGVQLGQGTSEAYRSGSGSKAPVQQQYVDDSDDSDNVI